MEEKAKYKYRGVVKLTGYRPFKYQYDIHDSLALNWYSTIHVIKAKRQIGKSILLENVLLKCAVERARTFSMCVSPTLNQSRKIYNEIVEATIDSCFFKKKNDSLLEISFKNHSTIKFASGEQRDALRGYTISGVLVLDEAAYLTDDIFNLLLPSTDVKKAPIVMASTPRYRKGFFYDNYILGLSDNRRTVFSYDINKYDTSNLLTPEKLEFYRQTLPANQFKTEYLGEFLNADSMVFGNFSECISNTYDENDKTYYYGIDWGTGSGKDYTAISILNSKKQMVDLYYFNDKDETSTIDYIVNTVASKYPPTKVTVELNSIGSIFYGLLNKKLKEAKIKCTVEGFVTTNPSKNKLVNNLQVAFQNQSIQILSNEELVNQISMYEAKVNSKTNSISYSAPSGQHDDLLIASMLAMHGCTTVTYAIR
jgi:hypothetical protein